MKKIFILTLVICIYVQKIQAQYYSTAVGLNGAALKTALHQIIKNHNDQGWPLWSFFSSTDDINGNQIWDIYSDIPGGTPPYMYTVVTNQCGTYSQEGNCYNHEHTWPSTYFNDNQPMRTDLNHVFPTDGWVNNKRSNFPYGNVTSVTWTSSNGSTLGTSNTYAGYTDKVFEPIDSFKGDLARVYFYMSTRYESEDAGWQNWVMANGAVLTTSAINLLLTWHHNDPVSQKELDRNEAVFTIQGNRNPFIDHPEYADCIWGAGDCSSLSIKKLSWENSIQLLPNPSTANLHIQIGNEIHLFSVQVKNMVGATFQTCSSNSLDISSLPVGNYVLSIATDKGLVHKLFTKN